MPENPQNTLSFDGKAAFAELGTAAALGLTRQSFTAEAWVRIAENAEGNDHPVFASDETAHSAGLHLMVRGGRPHFGFYGNDTAGRTALAKGAWTHLAWRYDAAAKEQAIFVNGVCDSSMDGHDPYLGTGMVRLGRWAGSFHFQGEISEARIWSSALPEKTIRRQMHSRAKGDEEGLTACWPLDDGKEKSGKNLVGGRSANLENVTLRTPAKGAGTGIEVEGRIATFESEKALAAIPDGPEFAEFGRRDFAVELWVCAGTSAQNQRGDSAVVAAKRGPENSGPAPFSIELHTASGRIQCHRTDGVNVSRVESQRSLYDGALHHVALVKEGGGLILYIDGKEDARAPDLVQGRVGNTAALEIGRLGGRHPFNGQISELRLWNRSRTAEEIAADHARRMAGDEAGLLGYWPLDASESGTGRDGKRRPPAALEGAKWSKTPDLPLMTKRENPPTLPALSFDGKGGHVEVPEPTNIDFDSKLSIEAWVRLSPHDAELYMGPVVSDHGPAAGWELRATSRGADMMVTANQTHYDASFPSPLPVDEWIHLAGTYDGQLVCLYLNGLMIASVGASGPITQFTGNLRIGQNAFWSDRCFAGQVAEVRLWKRVRTGEEILGGLFRRLKPDGQNELFAYWPMDRRETESLSDKAGDVEYKGILKGAVWVASELPPRLGAGRVEAEAPPEEVAKKAQAEAQSLVTKVEQKDRRIESLKIQQETAVETAKKSEGNIAELTRKLQDAEREIGNLKKERDKLAAVEKTFVQQQEAEGAVAIDTFIENTRKQIEEARTKLAGGSYALGSVKMELKMLPGPGGAGLIFPKKEEIGALGNSLSKIDVSFEEERPPEKEEKKTQKVPDVIGMTESLARRRLAEGGWLIQSEIQAIGKASTGGVDMDGRVVNQVPGPGMEATPNTTVQIFLGMKS